ncbi:MAG: sulfurtransferase-like selenium metabolism protein YedF [Clostridiaceae bacterium]|nr:sulfurtransferase-like selenium metabolism protein YedF [Eubacteriales bacterium]
MAKLIDAFGKSCPMPVVLAKKAADEGENELTIRVDNDTAVQNLTRFAAEMGFSIEVKAVSGGFEAALKKGNAGAQPEVPARVNTPGPQAGCGTSVFIGKEHVGAGDEKLGAQLMKMLLYTLSQGADVPASVLFMNGGVKLPTLGEEQVIESLNTLIERGAEVLVCGACLDFYGLKEQLKAGTVSNMYEIVSRMQSAAKVITV